MQKVILDTNIVVSGLIQRSYPHLILMSLFLERRFELCVSNVLMSEYHEVLNRPKFSKFPDFKLKVDSILLDIELHASLFYPKETINMIKDADDNMLLELALECSADFLVTGNTNDFTIAEFNKTRIVSPRDYWEFYKP